MATLIPKPRPFCSHHLSKNKTLLFLILLAILILIVSALSIYKASQKVDQLRHENLHLQSSVDQYQHQLNQLKNEDDARASKLEQAWAHQEELTQKLKDILAQLSFHSEMRETNLARELNAQKDMYLQAQQKIGSSEQQLQSLNQEMKYYKEQNQLMRQEQAKIEAKYQELLNQRPLNPQETLVQYLDSAENQEVTKGTANKLSECEKNNEEKLKGEKKQDHLNVNSARPVETLVKSSFELLKEAIKDNDVRGRSNQNKKNFKEPMDYPKQGCYQINQQTKETPASVHKERIMSPPVHKDKVKESQFQEAQESLDENPSGWEIFLFIGVAVLDFLTLADFLGLKL